MSEAALPNALPDTLPWYFRHGKRLAGPLTRDELLVLCAAAKVAPTDDVSNDGRTWTPVSASTTLGFQAAAGERALGYYAPDQRHNVMTDNAIASITQTASPALIMSVVLFLGALLSVLVAVSIGLRGIPGHETLTAGAATGSMVYAFANIMPGVYLVQYAIGCRRYGKSRKQTDLESALRSQKSFWKFSATFTLVVITLYFVVLTFMYVLADATS